MSLNSIKLGGTSTGFPFDNPGDSITGKIVALEEVQQTDLSTGEPAFWPNGAKKTMIRVTLATQLRNDPDDSGERNIYLKGSAKPETRSSMAAVVQAVRQATGGNDLSVGGTLTLTYMGDGERSQRGWNPPKLYSATYQPPVVGLPVQDAPAPAWTPPAPIYAAPAPAPAPVVPAGPPQPTAEQVAAIRAAGMDVKAVFPHYLGA